MVNVIGLHPQGFTSVEMMIIVEVRGLLAAITVIESGSFAGILPHLCGTPAVRRFAHHFRGRLAALGTVPRPRGSAHGRLRVNK